METTIYRTIKGARMEMLFEAQHKNINIKHYEAQGVSEEDYSSDKKYKFEILIRHGEETDAEKLFDEILKPKKKGSIKDLQSFFEEKDFNVHLFKQDKKQCAEIEKWTDGGVDMIINLMPFTVERFVDYVNNFNVDEEIDLHRQDKRYKDAFTISDSLKDFTNFHNHLKEIASALTN